MTAALALTLAHDLEERALTWPERANALTISDARTCEAAAELLRDIKTLRDEIAASTDPVIEAAHRAHKAALAQRKQLEAPLLAAEITIKGRLSAYVTEQERLRRIAEAEAAAAARKLEEDRRLAEAEALAAAGEAEEAERVLDEPMPAPPPPAVARAVPRTEGVATRETWSAEVTDLAALVRAIAEGKAPLPLVLPNLPALNSQAKSLRGAMAIPGVRAVCRRDVAVRGR